MIKIRYADLPPGRHAQVSGGGRRPVIYLLPGLSPAQRRDALRRLIRTSRQGYGPRLRVSGVAFAVARGAATSAARTGMAAARGHPAGSAVLAVFLAAAVVCYSLFDTVTVRLGPRPAVPPAAAGAAPSGLRQAGGPGRPPGGGASAPAGTQPVVTGPPRPPLTGGAGGAGSGPAGSAPPGSASSGSWPSGSGPADSGPSGPAAGPGPVPTGAWSAPGGVLSSVPAGAPPGSSSSPSPSAAPPPVGAGPHPPGQPGGLCLQLGSLGVCISG